MTCPSGLTRRQALAVGPAALALAAGLAACTDEGSPDPTALPSPSPPPSPPPSPSPSPSDPDVALRTAAAAREAALVREYDVVLAALPALSARLLPLRSQHVEHLAALSTGSPADSSASPVPSSSTGRAPAEVPPAADVAAALRRLTAAERSAGRAHGQDCLAASRALAGVLGALSASELSHEVALA